MRLVLCFIFIFVLGNSYSQNTLNDLTAEQAISDQETRLAIARLLKENKSYQEAIEQYRLILRQSPEHPDAIIEFALALSAQGDFQEAIDLLKPKAVSKTALLALASIYEAAGEFPKAQTIYSELLQREESDEISFRLAMVNVWQKQPDKAIPHLRKLSQKHPSNIQLKRHLARALGEAGQLDEALQLWRDTLPN